MDVFSELVTQEEFWELLYADDLLIVADTKGELQRRMMGCQKGLKRRTMKVNTRKSKVMASSKKGGEIISVEGSDGLELK